MWVEKNGPSFRVRDHVGGRKVTLAHGYATKTAAKAALATLRADQLRGESLVPRGGLVRLGEWLDLWWPMHEASLKPSTAYSEGARVRNHIRPLLGAYTLDELCQPLVLGRWLRQLSAGRPATTGQRAWMGLSPKTVRNCHGTLHTILDAAVGQRLIRANPCTESAKMLPARVHHEMRFLTEPEVGRLIGAVPAFWRPLVLLLVATGLRWGEAVALRVQDVDLLASPPRLTVLRTLHEMPATGEIVFTDPKSRMSRRTVTFPKWVAAELAPLALGDRGDLVFRQPRARGPVRVRDFRKVWVPWCEQAGLDPPRQPGERRKGGLRVHDLRHTHAAQLISKGVTLTAVQRRLGHASIAVTSDLYGHLLPEVDEGIMAAVEAALAQVDPSALQAEVEAELSAV